MFRNAVVCTDLSSSSDGIVKCAEQLGVLGVHDVVLAHVIELDRPGAMPGLDGDAIFERQITDLENSGIAVRIDTAVGYAPYEIERIAEEHQAGLIVAGSHGKGLFDGVMSGSVSSDLIRLTKRPVLLTAPAHEDDPGYVGASCASMLAHVLFPSDFTTACEHAARLTMIMAEMGATRVTLLHVVGMDAGVQPEFSMNDAQDRLADLAAKLRDMGVTNVDIEVVAGDPERVVSQAAHSGRYSLIVMGPHCSAGSEGSLDSVTDAVLQRTTIPVLLAPPGWQP